MQSAAEEPPCKKMAELILACEREILTQRERAGLAASSFSHHLRSIRSAAEETLKSGEKIGNLKDYLRGLEADLAGILAVKARKEAKRIATAESLSRTVARTEELKKIIKDQRTRKDGYAEVISQQLVALETLEEKSNRIMIERKNIEEAIMWYERVLGFLTEAGEGVKFIFNKIDAKNPDGEHAFTIRLDGDIYTLVHCDPYVEGINVLIKDLNKTNDLFKFVRIMREKFRAAALNGVLPSVLSASLDSTSVTVSSPPPTSVDSRSETPIKQNDLHVQVKKVMGDPPQRVNPRQIGNPSPQSVSAFRRSPRFVVKRFP